MKTIGALTALAIALAFLDGSSVEWVRDGEPWRIVTCHFTHWSHEQLAWDVLAFAGLGSLCVRNNLRAFHATLLASVLLIPIAVQIFAPDVTAYRGLSGIDSALFALLLVQSRRSKLAIVCGIGFVAKIAFETITGGAVFASHMGADVISVPVAHIAGALIGLIVGAPKSSMMLAPAMLSACVTFHSPAPSNRLTPGACSATDLTGVWTARSQTQLGPAWIKLVLHRDCRFYLRYQLAWARFTVSGNYAVAGNELTLIGRDQEDRMPFTLRGNKLVTDSKDGQISYTRGPCGSSSRSSRPC